MGYFSNLDIERQEDNLEMDESPSQDDIEQHEKENLTLFKPQPSEEAIWRFLDWLDSKSTTKEK